MEKSRPDKGLFAGERVDDKEIEGGCGDNRLDPYFTGTEPVLLLAAVEQDLQGSDRNA